LVKIFNNLGYDYYVVVVSVYYKQSTGQLVELPQGVYCIDNDRIGVKPAMAVGAAKKIYVIRMATSQAMLR